MIEISFSQKSATEAEQAQAENAAASWRSFAGAGFYRAAMADATWDATSARAKELKGQFDQYVLVGIGGSSFGAKALITAAGGRQPLYFDHIEPETVRDLRGKIQNLRRTHWVLVSKSGGTLETLAALNIIEQWYEAENLSLNDFATVVAGDGIQGALQAWAVAQKVKTLPIGADVSGRFSVFTAAGLLPAALSGLDLTLLRKGLMAADADRATVATIAGETLASWRRDEWITMVWTYGDRLRPMAGWLQQLWTESLGKKVDRKSRPAPQASFLVPCVGSIDQHSILQQVVEGQRDKWVWFWDLKSLAEEKLPIAGPLNGLPQGTGAKTLGQLYLAQSEGTRRALNEVGVHTASWAWPNCNFETVGYVMFLMQAVVASLGECLAIETYNQPGVERGKKITLDLLSK